MLITTFELRTQLLRAYSIRTIREWARDGVIPSVRIARKLMFDPVEVLAALKRRTVAVQP
jgi:hypothetical protein